MTAKLLCELKAAIAERKLTLLDVDHRAGLASGHSGRIVRGEKDPQLDTFARMVEAIDYDLALVPRERTPP